MNRQMVEIMRRRQELLARITSQRMEIAEVGRRWRPFLTLADQGLAGIRLLRSRPALVAAVVALLVIRRRGLVGLATGCWRVWKRYRDLKAFSAKLPSLF